MMKVPGVEARYVHERVILQLNTILCICFVKYIIKIILILADDFLPIWHEDTSGPFY